MTRCWVRRENECHYRVLRPKWPIQHTSHDTLVVLYTVNSFNLALTCAYITKRHDVIFFTSIFGSSRHRKNGIGNWNSKGIMNQKHVLLYKKKMPISKFAIIWAGLTSLKLVRMHHRSNDNHYRVSIFMLQMTQKTCVARYAGGFYFIVTCCDLTFTLTF